MVMDVATKNLMASSLFSADDFEQIWVELNQLHEMLGFTPYESDEAKISEYKYVTQQLRKYMASKKGAVIGCDSVQDMVACVEDLIDKQREYGNTRADILYNFMRDHWLVQLYNVLSRMAAIQENEEEDE